MCRVVALLIRAFSFRCFHINKASNLLVELDLEVREGGFKLGGVLLDVATEYSVPVVLVTVDGYTVAVLF